MSSHGLSGVELTKRSLSARTSKQNGNCNATPYSLAKITFFNIGKIWFSQLLPLNTP